MKELLGHFHPVFVHLPIGILIIGVVLQWMSRKEKYTSLKSALPLVWLLGMIGAIISCITGLMLSGVDDYDEKLVSWHQWLAIAVAIISIILYTNSRRHAGNSFQFPLTILIFLLILIVGHLGGSLTHGSDYLTRPFSNLFSGKSNEIAREPIPNIQEALVYDDVVAPILESRCYGCHGSSKQKGKLRLDKQEFIIKGGKNGEVLLAGNPDESELMKRLLLPKEHEDHMPPKEKPQLTENDIAVLHWWISNGAGFDKRVKQLAQEEKIKPVLLALQSGKNTEVESIAAVPEETVDPADPIAVKALKQLGVVIIPVARNSNYLSANFVIASGTTDEQLKLLEPLSAQLVWLKLGDRKITDSGMVTIGKLAALTRLHLENTLVTDWGLSQLKALSHLQFINLTGTTVTTKGIYHLKDLPQLSQIYLYRTGANTAEWAELKKNFPNTYIDTGGYFVATLESDTTEVKPKENNSN